MWHCCIQDGTLLVAAEGEAYVTYKESSRQDYRQPWVPSSQGTDATISAAPEEVSTCVEGPDAGSAGDVPDAGTEVLEADSEAAGAVTGEEATSPISIMGERLFRTGCELRAFTLLL